MRQRVTSLATAYFLTDNLQRHVPLASGTEWGRLQHRGRTPAPRPFGPPAPAPQTGGCSLGAALGGEGIQRYLII